MQKILMWMAAAPLLTSSLLAQAPAPAAVVNPASNTPAGLPNGGIAQGAIFVVYGKNLGPTTLVQASALPLPTTAGLSGTSIQVTVNGTTTVAPIVYTLGTQVAAVLPSSTPVGTGTLTVTYNGQTGTTPIKVVGTNFGISTVNQTGAGPAVVTRPDYSVITVTNSAKPGETLVLWGTGLGPITGSDAVVPTSGDLKTPIQLLVGGQTANVTYRGRSAAPGLDQINFTVPANVTGCYVSLAVQTNSTVSNYTTIPIATNGGTCSDSTGVSIDSLTGVLSSGTARLGIVSLTQTSITTPAIGPVPASTRTTASASADFYSFTSAQLTQAGSISGTPSVGGCLVTVVNGSTTTSSLPAFSFTGLDAGPQIPVNGPQTFNMTAIAGTKGVYSASLSAGLTAGTYTAVGPGGADVGAFSVAINAATPLTWTNQTSAATVDRTQPFTVNWTGGDPNGFVVIEGTSISSTANPTIGAIFVCTAPVAAGKFTIPSSVLLSLPPSSVTSAGGFSIPSGFLLVGTSSNPKTFSAPGLDSGIAEVSSFGGTLMTYQ